MSGGVYILAVVLVLASTISLLAENADAGNSDPDNIWPMLGGDAQHTGQSRFNISDNQGGLLWTVEDIVTYISVAIDEDGVIYAPSGIEPNGGYLRAIDPNGTLKWSFGTGGYAFSCPAIAEDGTIYLGCFDHYLYSLFPNGTERWKFITGDEVRSSPVIDDQGMVYFCSRDGKLYCLDQEGDEQWNYSCEGIAWMNPALNHEGQVIFGSTNGIHCIYPNGTLRWSKEISGLIDGTISIDHDGNIYLINRISNEVLSLDSEGEIRWSYIAIVEPNGVSVGSDGTVYFGAIWDLIALNPDGTLKWRFETGGTIPNPPAISSDSTIIFGSHDGNVYALNEFGEEVWRYTGEPFKGEWCSPAIGSDGTVYIANYGYDQLVAINGVPELSTSLIAGAVFALLMGVIIAIWAAYPKK